MHCLPTWAQNKTLRERESELELQHQQHFSLATQPDASLTQELAYSVLLISLQYIGNCLCMSPTRVGVVVFSISPSQ